MSDIIIKAINEKDTALIQQVETLFVEMYDYFSKKGLALSLIKDGEKLWSNSIMPTLNRMNMLQIANYNGNVVGFASAYLRFTPDYQGSLKIGVISYLYVKPDMQEKGMGNLLVKAIENWFTSKNVHSIELQVVYKNDNAMSFWKKSGYKKESIQFRKEGIKPNN